MQKSLTVQMNNINDVSTASFDIPSILKRNTSGSVVFKRGNRVDWKRMALVTK